MKTNVIKTIAEGVFAATLDFPDEQRVIEVVSDKRLPYVLLVGARVGNFTWQQFHLTGLESLSGLSRAITGDFLVKANDFDSLRELISWRWAIQLEEIPPDYFDFEKIKGSQRYTILKACGFQYVLESQTGGGDYATLITQSRNLLQRAIDDLTASNG